MKKTIIITILTFILAISSIYAITISSYDDVYSLSDDGVIKAANVNQDCLIVDSSGGGKYTDLGLALQEVTTGCLIIADGTYSVSEEVDNYAPTDLTIYASKNAIITISGDYMLRFNGAENFKWIGGKLTGAGSGKTAFWFNKGINENIEFDNMHCYNFNRVADSGCVKIYTQENNVELNNFKFTNNICENMFTCFGGELKQEYTNNKATNFLIENNIIESVSYGITLNNGNSTDTIANIKVNQNTIENITRTDSSNAGAIHFGGSSSASSNYLTITNNYIKDIYNSTGTMEDHEAIYFKSDKTIVEGNTIINGGWFSIGLKKGIADSNNYINVQNNIIEYETTYKSTYGDICCGIRGNAGLGVVISNNNIKGVEGTIGDRTGCGIDLSGTNGKILISGNIVSNCTIGIGGECSTSGASGSTGIITDNYVTGTVEAYKYYMLSLSGNYGITDKTETDINLYDYSLTFNGQFTTELSDTLTISSGEITITSAHHTIDTEALGATDDLDCIVGSQIEGEHIWLRAASDSRDITFKDSTCATTANRLRMYNGAGVRGDYTIANRVNEVECIYHGTSRGWLCKSWSN